MSIISVPVAFYDDDDYLFHPANTVMCNSSARIPAWGDWVPLKVFSCTLGLARYYDQTATVGGAEEMAPLVKRALVKRGPEFGTQMLCNPSFRSLRLRNAHTLTQIKFKKKNNFNDGRKLVCCCRWGSKSSWAIFSPQSSHPQPSSVESDILVTLG